MVTSPVGLNNWDLSDCLKAYVSDNMVFHLLLANYVDLKIQTHLIDICRQGSTCGGNQSWTATYILVTSVYIAICGESLFSVFSFLSLEKINEKDCSCFLGKSSMKRFWDIQNSQMHRMYIRGNCHCDPRGSTMSFQCILCMWFLLAWFCWYLLVLRKLLPY